MVKKYSFLLVLVSLCYSPIFAQVLINPGVDTTDANSRSVVKFYTEYIQSFKGRKLPDFNKYWSEADRKKYKIPDPSVFGAGGDFPTYLMAELKTIHYVKPLANGIYNVKMTGGWLDSLKKFNVEYITSQYIERKEDGSLSFVRPFIVLGKNWQSKKLETITYHYPKYHHFNKKAAENLRRKIKQLQADWEVAPIDIDYFFADTYEEIQLIRGYEFTMGSGNANKPMGISDQTDHAVFCAGQGEDYFHEVVHIYLNPLHKKSPLNEGLAVYYGGSLGNALDWHIARLKTYLNNHPEIDLNRLDDFYYMDNYTNPKSTMQGLLCKLVNQKHGILGLKRLMRTYSSMNEIFEKEFNLNVKNLNTELRALINQQIK